MTNDMNPTNLDATAENQISSTSGELTNKIVRAVEDATTFPVLAEPVSMRPAVPAGGLTPMAFPSLGSLVQNTLHEVLQWRPSPTDVKGLKNALLVSFNAQEEKGRTVYTHVPRSYIMQVQADGGAVTGAQASIHTRASAAVAQCLPLLDGLYPLGSDTDPEDLSAVRATIRMALAGLVEELARPAGPRVQRVDTLFELLLGEGTFEIDPDQFKVDQVGGQLGLLRKRLGLSNLRINNAEEEKNLTNYLILVDHAFTLSLSWESQRELFARNGGDVYLGPQLVLLSRALRVVSESVHEAYDALSSVFVGPEERQVILLYTNGGARLTLADLLEWVDTFASQEGPQFIQQAGKDGVIAFRSTLKQLSGLLEQTVTSFNNGGNHSSRGLHTARVAAALNAVRLHVDAALELTLPLSRLPQPEIHTIVPASARQRPGVRVVIEGANFDPKAKARLVSQQRDESVESVDTHHVSPTTLIATFNLANTTPSNAWTLEVSNESAGPSATASFMIISAQCDFTELAESPPLGTQDAAEGSDIVYQRSVESMFTEPKPAEDGGTRPGETPPEQPPRRTRRPR